MTQMQLAAVISRTGKYLSEVETGRAKLTEPELNKLATALGVTLESLLKADPAEIERQSDQLPRRIRDSQPVGLTIFPLQPLLDYVDRAGWLRGCRIWSISAEAFAEERDVALVEQLADLATSRAVRLRYVFPKRRIHGVSSEPATLTQGSRSLLPASLRDALAWSDRLGQGLNDSPDMIGGYALDESFPCFSLSHSYLWFETVEASWSEVMPLLFGRCETRTHENSNASVPFWYHVPRDHGSHVVITLAQWIKAIDRKPVAP